jgi:DnaJ like chaperone protein
MSFVGRIIAAARDLPFGGPLGALLARAARHIPSWHAHSDAHGADNDPRRRIAFTIAVIALGAKMATADGVVTRDEVAAFGEVFQVPPGEEAHVRLVFDLARKSTAGFESYARQVGRLFANDRAVLENLLGGLFHIALADGRIDQAEDAYLREVARQFGFDTADYVRVRALHVGSEAETTEDPYAILGVAPHASPNTVRAAYHRLLRENHPDLLVAQGLPPECIALATARVARINTAYEQITNRGRSA